MPKRWTRPLVGRAWGSVESSLPLLVLAVLVLAVPACMKDDDKLLRPGSVVSNVITAAFVPPEQFEGHEIKLDGEAKDSEWGGPLDPERPYAQIRLSSEAGSGEPGDPVYVSMKAVYTETDLFLLLRWADSEPNALKDALYYVGPDLTARRGCQDILTAESSWSYTWFDDDNSVFHPRQDEDRMTLAFEMNPVGDSRGTYATQGCLVACHPGSDPAFGRPGYGRLDVWQWLAARTNVVRRTYLRLDNANFPVFGVPGYLDDYSADPVAGLVPDPGRSPWFPNTNPGSARPRYIYRYFDDIFANPSDPDNCFNEFGEKCRINNGLPYYYIWWEDVERVPYEFGRCDTINVAVLPQGRPERKWQSGDRVSAYYYSYPTDSRADVRGKGVFSDGIWTLEVGRPLSTADPANDIIFTGIPGQEVVFTLAMADNSRTRHWGSGPQILRLGEKAPGKAGSAGDGDGL